MRRECHHCWKRPTRYQVAGWLTCIALPCLFYSLVLPSLPTPDSVYFLVGYTASISATLFFGLLCTFVDPSDVGLKYARNPSCFSLPCPSQDLVRFCPRCQARVSEHSVHCDVCDRCIGYFDHHCNWVNNCIGQANYRWFFGSLVSLEMTVIGEGYATGFVLLDIFGEGLETSNTLGKYDFGEKGYLFLATLLFLEAMSVLIALSNGFLLFLQIFLGLHRMLFPYSGGKRKQIAKVHPSNLYSSSQTRGSPRSRQELARMSSGVLPSFAESRGEKNNRPSINETALGGNSSKIEDFVLERKLGESHFEGLQRHNH